MTIDITKIAEASAAAAAAIPPAWPLAATVAVNPWLGQTGEPLAMVAARMARAAGVAVTMERSWYAARIASGVITDDDLAAALAAAPSMPSGWRPENVAALKAAALTPSPAPRALPTVAELAAEATGVDWPSIIAERFGHFAAGWFDEGQALWAAPRGRSALAAWRAVATHDLTPELLGLGGFSARVAEAPDAASPLLAQAVAQLGLTPAAMTSVFHRALSTLGGWAQAARYRQWQAQLVGSDDGTITDFLAIRLLWEVALLDQLRPLVGTAWEATVAAHAVPLTPTPAQCIDAILQEAAERAGQRSLAARLAVDAPPAAEAPALQMAFCIDVRSEVFRRSLEAIDPRIQTLGFAGFFGLTAAHRRLGSDVAEHRLPVLLNPGFTSTAGNPEDVPANTARRLEVRVVRAWARFKLAAVSSFAFVEAAGPTYGLKLLRDALGIGGASPDQDPAPRPDPALDLPGRVRMTASILRAMSLTRGFAPLVMLAGHGANVVNNPHASALHCGACGGYTGDVNARLLATLLNDPQVRAGLSAEGIAVPETTLFLAALHDTTTDAVRLFDADAAGPAHHNQIARARQWLDAAGAIARSERAIRLPRATGGAQLVRRSTDWAETRPEWGLAGCQAFIAAPRARTAGRNLAGRAFLHDYVWRDDEGFGVLELILTAPVVVASWISLQYYGSCVAPELFGGGNKLLHNVVGGFGVVEGNGGALRTGLPWQSVHDGAGLAHEPLRLTVCVEAPIEAMTTILWRHPAVAALFDNRWLHLIALDDSGRMAWRYAGQSEWVPMESADAATPLAA
ncbi:YbcC family protein [Polymorphobacter sp.]|uniref:YbcC family protein n=1 Tax=Polymorphobacter sp. TaxID=1909290 RepID=UPI003F6EF3EA